MLRLRFALLVAVAVAGVAFAQQPDEPPSSPNGQEKKVDEDGEEVVSDDQLVPVANSYLGEMRTTHTKGLDRLREAREQKDAVLLTCVNVAVTGMKGVLRVSEDALLALQEAQATASGQRARYEFSKIRVSRKKMKELYQESLNCAGAESTTSNTTVEVEIDPSIAEDDPYYGDPDFFFTPEDTLVDDTTGELGDTEDPPYVRPPPASDII